MRFTMTHPKPHKAWLLLDSRGSAITLRSPYYAQNPHHPACYKNQAATAQHVFVAAVRTFHSQLFFASQWEKQL